MDGSQFDSLSKRLAVPRTRRQTLLGIGKAMVIAAGIGGPIGAIVASKPRADARSCSAGGSICRGDATCCSGTCQTASDGRGRCACEDGTTTCGIYEDRPTQCRLFPIDRRDVQEVRGTCSFYFIEKPIKLEKAS